MQSQKNHKKSKLSYLLLLLHNTNLIFSLGVKLFKLFPNIEKLFDFNTNLEHLGLTSAEVIKLKNPNWREVEQDLCWAEQSAHHIITLEDDDYPELLREIQNPPLLLFAIGDLQLLKAPQLAIVGSRNPTVLGIENGFYFAKEMVQAGLVVTSGLALGVDGASHRGAIAALGKTIAVMGTGLNHIYPSCHKELTQKIIEIGGVLLSEFPLAAGSKAWHFPLRNRIISGLSLGTLVVEATLRSGSLITARFAGEQGREVFAIPGSIYNPVARGCHYLIRQGAKLVEQPEDIFEEFPQLIKSKKLQLVQVKKVIPKNKLDSEHKKLLDCMGFEITSIDVLASRPNWPVAKIGAMLLELELRGLIKVAAGGYIRV